MSEIFKGITTFQYIDNETGVIKFTMPLQLIHN